MVMGWRSKIKENITIRNKLVREALAEFIGTFILLFFGDASVAQNVLGRGKFGSFQSVNWSWGLAVTMGVYFSAGVSGGHINPAVSLAQCVIGRMPWYKFPVYMLAQNLGAFTASACVFGVYYDALNEFDGGIRMTTGPNATAGIWATYPKDFVSTATGFGDQVLGTALLMSCIMAITDEKNEKPPKGMVPLIVGLVVVVIGMTLGYNCGYGINPARDLSPRIFTAIAGWGLEPFKFRNYNWFWVPVIGPHIGAILGAWLYLLIVGIHFPESDSYDIHSKPPENATEMVGEINPTFTHLEPDAKL